MERSNFVQLHGEEELFLQRVIVFLFYVSVCLSSQQSAILKTNKRVVRILCRYSKTTHPPHPPHTALGRLQASSLLCIVSEASRLEVIVDPSAIASSERRLNSGCLGC